MLPIFLLAAAVASPTTEQTLIDLETRSWAAWQKMDAGFWNRFLSDDHIEVSGYAGATGKKSKPHLAAAIWCPVALGDPSAVIHDGLLPCERSRERSRAV